MKGNRPATVSLAARVRVLASRLVAALARALAPTFMANRARVLASTLRLAVRRLWVRRRYTAGLLAGFVLAVAAAASVPLFTAGALQRLLEAELRSAGQRHPAGIHIAHLEHPQRRTRAAQFDAADAIARTVGPALIGLPIDTFVRYGALEPTRARSAAPGRLSPRERWLSLAFLSDLEHHVQVTDGRLPQPDPTPDGFLEAMVEEAALDRQDLTVGAELVVPLGRDPGAGEVKVRIVGAFVRADPEEAYWFQAGPFDQHLFLPEETFRTQVLPREGAAPGQYSWYYGVPADALRVTDAVRLLGALYDLEARMAQALPDTRIFAGPVDLLTRYALRSLDLQRLLILLLMPALAAIGYFLVVTAGMMVEGQRQEIATLRSRGASPGQIAGLYLVEGLVLAGVALALGLPLGALLARAMGAVAGFLQFVRRTQPPLLLSGTFWGYGLAAAGLAALAYLLPALPAARQSIVAQKQEAARRLTRPLWSRLGLDFLLLGLAGYSYYTLARPGAGALIPLAPGGAGEAWAPAAAPGAAGAPAAGPGEAGGLALGIRLMEPLHLVAPFLLILGAGLFLLRLVPLLAGLGARLAERGRGTALYLALVQLSRAGASYAPVILLLTVT
ncbi:MAG: FtsX-like permease family protein, partial [Bacillota bacterium]